MAQGMNARKPVPYASLDERRTETYYWWLLLAIFFEYARPGAFVPGIEVAKVNTLIPLTLLLIALFAKGMRPFSEIFADRAARWLTAYMGLIVLSVPFADVTLYSFDIFKKVLGYYFLFIIIARIITSTRRLHGLFVVLILSHLFLIAMNPMVVLNPDLRAYIRGGTFLGDGNDFSLSLCILLPMAIELAQSARSKVKALIAWASLLVMVFGVVGTQSRGATLAMCGVFGFLWLYSNRKPAFLAGILAVGIAVTFYASDAYFERMGTIRHYEQDGSAEGRILAWKAALRMAADHPLMGVSTGHFPVAYGSKYMRHDLGSMPWLTAHSMYFLILGELGLPGIVCLCALVFGAIAATLSVRRRLLSMTTGPPSNEVSASARLLKLLAASCVAFAIAGAFLSVAYYPHVFVLTGILVSARAVATANSGASQPSVARRTSAVIRPGQPGRAT